MKRKYCKQVNVGYAAAAHVVFVQAPIPIEILKLR